MKRFGYLYGNKGQRKFLALFHSEFQRNCFAAADRSSGFRVRKFERRQSEPTYYGA